MDQKTFINNFLLLSNNNLDNSQYNILNEYHKYCKYKNNIIQQNVFKTKESDSLIDVILKSLSVIKDNIKNSGSLQDLYSLSSNDLLNLLKSFGFTYLDLTSEYNRKILSKLINLYKIKGTISSLVNIVHIVSPTIHIIPVSFLKQKNIPYFIYNRQFNNNTITKFIKADQVIQNDPHFYQTYTELCNYKFDKAMSPYLALYDTINLQDSLKTITLLRTKATKDLNAYNDDPSNFKQFQNLSIELLPDAFSYLELYLMIRYIYVQLTNQEGSVKPSKQLSYSYKQPSEDTDLIIDQFNSLYETRQTQPFLCNKSKTTVAKEKTTLTTLYIQNKSFPQSGKLMSIPSKNNSISMLRNFIVQYSNRKLTLTDINDASHSFSINLQNKIDNIQNPILIPNNQDFSLTLTAGEVNNSPNYRTYNIDLHTYQVRRLANIPMKFYFTDPVVVTNQKFTYVISTKYTDYVTGGIYIWNPTLNYKQLVALISPDIYDITTIQAAVNHEGDLVVLLKLKSPYNQKWRMLYLSIKNNYFSDITCLVTTALSKYKSVKQKFLELFSSNLISFYMIGNTICLYRKDNSYIDYILFNLHTTFGPNVLKLVPRTSDGILTLQHICRTVAKNYMGEDKLSKIFSLHMFDYIKTEVIDTQNWNPITRYHINLQSNEINQQLTPSLSEFSIVFPTIYDYDLKISEPFWPYIEQAILSNISDKTLVQKLQTLNKFIPNSNLPNGSYTLNIYNFPKMKYINFDYETKVIGNQKNVNKENFTFNTPVHSNFNIDIYDTDFHFEQDHSKRHVYMDYSILNSDQIHEVYHRNPSKFEYCYDFYDSVYQYDTDVNLKQVCYNRLPDINPHRFKQFPNRLYNIKSYPQYIETYLTPRFITVKDFIKEYYNVRYQFTYDNQIIQIAESNSSYYISNLNILSIIDKIVPLKFQLSYTENTKGARYGRNKILQQRNENFVNKDLLSQNSFDDLSSLLLKINEKNKLTIDSSTNKILIFNSLINLTESIFNSEGSLQGLTLLYTKNIIMNLIDIFKPIYSRVIDFSCIIVNNDPVGDAIALADDQPEIFPIKTVSDSISFFEKNVYNLNKQIKEDIILLDKQYIFATKFFKDNILFKDVLNIKSSKSFTDYLHMNDKFTYNKTVAQYDTNLKYDEKEA